MSVNILCPNGRRQVVKVTPNKTILQIIEEVCIKRGFEAAKHDLKHGRNTLEINTAYRFSGIPNNGKLELVERETPRSSQMQVTIALQLDSGERRQKSFNSDCSLLEMIKEFQKPNEDLLHTTSNTDLCPVIVNMREEIIGLAMLEHTTLHAIGLVSGRVALRLIYRHVEQATLDQISLQLQQDMVKKEKSVASTAASAAASAAATTSSESSKEAVADPVPQSLQDCESKGAEQTDSNSRNPQMSAEKLSESQLIHTTETPPPTGEKSETKRSSPGQTSATNMETQDKSVSVVDSSMSAVKPKIPRTATVSPAVEFKFPEETAGKDLYHNEMSDSQTHLNYVPCDRETIVFSLDEISATQGGAEEDLQDDFYEVTKNDLQIMIHDLRQQVLKDENAPLLTSSMRQAQLESKYSKYQFSTIRFHFPHRVVVQAKFKPYETVYSLSKFVKSQLKDESTPFHLYTTPPKKVLDDMAVTLIAANLIPMAIVHVGFSGAVDGSVLTNEILDNMQSRHVADESAKQSLPERVVSHSRPQPSIPVAPQRSQSSSSNTQGSTSAERSSMPKWYKPSGK